MSSYRVYRFYEKRHPDTTLNKNSYVCSLIVASDYADFVVPTTAEPGRLAGLRDSLDLATERAEASNNYPKSINEMTQLAASNVGTYYSASLVFESDEPSLSFTELRKREQNLIDDWMHLNEEPNYVSV